MEEIDSLVLQGQERFTQYQTYEQLHAHWWKLSREYSNIAHVEQWGRGSDRDEQYPSGRPIEALVLSNPREVSKRPFALLQMEHENELPTTLAIQLIADIICENPELLDELGYNLILLNTTHPDGIALQTWIEEDEFTPLNYALGFYRSAASEQVAWGYPFRHKKAAWQRVTAENQASMRLIEYYAPTFLHSFHAAGIDDAYAFVHDSENRPLIEGIVRSFQSRGLHLQQGAPEASHYQKVNGYTGIYSPLPGAGQSYDALYDDTDILEEIEWGSGTMAVDFVNGVTDMVQAILTEVPYLTADALRDQSPAGMTYEDALQVVTKNQVANLQSIDACLPTLNQAIQHDDTPQSQRLLRSLTWYSGLIRQTLAAPQRIRQVKREVTTAEAFGVIERGHYYDLLFRGEVHHLAGRLGLTAMATDIRDQLAMEINGIHDVSRLHTLPLPKLVGAQALCALNGLYACRPH